MNTAFERSHQEVPDTREIEAQLEKLPLEHCKLLRAWRHAEIEREKIEAMLFLKYRSDAEKRTVDEIKALVRVDDERTEAKIKEADAEARFDFIDQKLMSLKKKISLRSAF